MTPAHANMTPEMQFMFMMHMFQQQSAALPKLPAEQSYFQQQADDLQLDNDACRECKEQTAMLCAANVRCDEDARRVQADAMLVLQSSSQEALRTHVNEVKQLSVQRPESARWSSIKLPPST
jgi:hypothetical protein